MTDQTGRESAARNGEEIVHRGADQDWVVSWYPPLLIPRGRPDGATGICVTSDGTVVVISEDGEHWDLPGGRPEGDETWEETLRREVREEACARVGNTRLLGFCRSVGSGGPQANIAKVRSLWWAEVTLDPWAPQFEIASRRLVAVGGLLAQLTMDDGLARIACRALREATDV